MSAEHSNKPNEILASFVLIAATIAALVIANSGAAALYKSALASNLSVGAGFFAIDWTVKDWIKNALMAVFFVLVGLEIKAEFKEGALSDRQRAILPFVAAAGGMAAPALVYIVVTGAAAATLAGWAIPSATDIAFAIGVVGLLGRRRVPAELKAFLLAVAVIDDLGAILIIAVFYTGGLDVGMIAASVVCCGVLLALNLTGRTAIWPYLVVGAVLWFVLGKSGINPTLAGVIVAIAVPLKDGTGGSPLHTLADRLQWPVVMGIMPLFAFANAGVSLAGLGLERLAQPVTLGVMLGLFIGKPLGILSFVWLAVASGIARLPAGSTWFQVLGIAWMAGIGFTMSLFIGALAFGEGPLQDAVRIGVLAGSTLSAIAGAIALSIAATVARARLAAAP